MTDSRTFVEGETVWHTSLGVVARGTNVWTRVELAMETDRPQARDVVGRPRVVSDLLELAPDRDYRGTPIWAAEREYSANRVTALIDVLRDETRAIPMLVFTEPPAWSKVEWRDAARRVARRVQGVANVVVLENDAVTALKESLGSLAVWGGGIRTYFPAPLDSPDDSWRHRFTPFRVFAEAGSAVENHLVSAMCQMSARRRPAAELAVLDRWVISETSGDETEALQRELSLAQDDLDEVSAELSRVAICPTVRWPSSTP